MKRSILKNIYLVIAAITISQTCFAYADTKPWYVAAGLGIFEGNYDIIYNDITDGTPQDIRQTLQQFGYNGAVAVGYQKFFANNYFLGAEFSAAFTSNKANFNSGSAGTAFTDQFQIKNYFDLVIVPGFYLTDSVQVYLKGGLSYAITKDSLNSPTTAQAIYVTTNSTDRLLGLALGIGIKKFITPQCALLAEYQYHDYGKLNLPNFVNFTADYTHAVNVYSQAVMLGFSYSV